MFDPREAPAARAKAQASPTLPLDIGGGKVVQVPVCWPADKCAAYLKANWNGGPMVLATMQSPDYAPKGTAQELEWFLRTADSFLLAQPSPMVPATMLPLAARAAAEPAKAAPAAAAKRRVQVRT